MSSFGFGILPTPTQDGVRRTPPPSPTPLDFPRCSTSLPKLPLTPESTKSFQATYTGIRKPADVRLEHIEGLNVTIEHDVELEDLIPVDPADGVSALPPRSWTSVSSDSDDAAIRALQFPVKKLSTGKLGPNIEQFRQRCAELSYDNNDAFHVIQRKPPVPGKPPTKPGQYYRFWQGLDLLAQWWDTSQDSLLVDEEAVSSGRNYTGRRIGTGRDLPEQYREDCVKGFVEVISWEFGCRLQPPRAMPRLAVRTSLFPSRFNTLAYRLPAEIAEQRAGILEGPILAVQCRPETCFRSPGEEVGSGQAEVLDFMREIVGALIVAQERTREGKEEKKPGAGKWWSEAPRWGGGPGGEVGNPVGNSDDPVPPVGRGRTNLRGDRRASNKKLDRQGSSTWDKKIRYQAIGKHKESGVDDIFLISSINHHISILHLRVSHSYLRFLESGALPRYPVSPSLKSHTGGGGTHSPDAMDTSQPATNPATPVSPSYPADNGKDRGSYGGGKEPRGACLPHDWYILKVRRSRWFDLLEKEGRVEAMRGIWGVFGYMMREVGEGETLLFLNE
ncbi:MAG: hypothetical protein M1839_000088 [Geoglossum umbratile]|nr:MAG: hypothetical protein M1839_000088 [Geoglossum umbratile]